MNNINRGDTLKKQTPNRPQLKPSVDEEIENEELDVESSLDVDFEELINTRNTLNKKVEAVKAQSPFLKTLLEVMIRKDPEKFKSVYEKVFNRIRNETNFLEEIDELKLDDIVEGKVTGLRIGNSLMTYKNGNLVFWDVDLSGIEAGGVNYGFYSDIDSSMPGAETILKSLFDFGGFPSTIHTLIHEVTHNKQRLNPIKEALFDSGEGRTALVEAQARFAENDSSSSIKVIDEIGGDDLKGSLRRTRPGRHYYVEPEQLIEATYVCRRLYALGFKTREIAKMLEKDKWSEKKGRFVNLEKIIEKKKKELKLSDDDVDNLITARKIESEIEKRKVQLIAQEELENFINTDIPHVAPYNWDIAPPSVNLKDQSEYVEAIEKFEIGVNLEADIPPTDYQFSHDRYTADYFTAIQSLLNNIGNLSVLKEKYENLKLELDSTTKKYTDGNLDYDTFLKESYRLLILLKETVKPLSELAINSRILINKIESIQAKAKEYKDQRAVEAGFKSAQNLGSEMRRLKETNLFNRNAEKIISLQEIDNIFVPPQLNYSDMARAVNQCFDYSTNKIVYINELSSKYENQQYLAAEGLIIQEFNDLKPLKQSEVIDDATNIKFLQSILSNFLKNFPANLTNNMQEIYNFIVSNRKNNYINDLDDFCRNFAVKLGLQEYDVRRVTQEIWHTYRSQFLNRSGTTNELFGIDFNIQKDMTTLEFCTWVVNNVEYIEDIKNLSSYSSEQQKKYPYRYNSKIRDVLYKLERFLRVIDDNVNINVLNALLVNYELKQSLGEAKILRAMQVLELVDTGRKVTAA
jgi:hypothetical protein